MTTSYTAGTVSVSAGSRTVTGTGTNWVLANISPGYFGLSSGVGPTGPAEEIISDTEFTLVVPWSGPTLVDQPYWLSYDTRDGQQTVNNATRLAEYVARLDSDSLSAIAALDPASDTLIMFTGSSTATLIPVGQLGGLFDVQVADLAERAAYDTRPAGFKVLVSDVGGGVAALYSRVGVTPGVWSDPAYITGPAGPSGQDGAPGGFTTIQAGTVTSLPYGQDATVDFVPVSSGVVSINFGIPAGEDGTGTGDVVGPSSSVDSELVLFSGTSGKQIKRGPVIGNSASRNVGTGSGTVAAGDDPRFSAGGQNEAILALEIADLKGARLGMKGGVADAFDDETGVDVKTNATYDATNDWYTPVSSSAGTVVSSLTQGAGSSLTSRSFRNKVASAGISASGNYVRIRLFGPPSGTSKIVDNVFIGRGVTTGNLWNFDTSAIAVSRVTFNGGSSSVTPPVGGFVWSDWIPFALNNAFPHIVSIDVNAASGAGSYTSSLPTNWTGYYSDSGDQAAIVAPSGFAAASNIWLIDRIEATSSLGVQSMTLRSISYVAASQPTTGRLAVQLVETDAISINTDVVGRISRDGGTTWATAALSLSQSLIGPKIYEATGIGLSSLGAGTSMRWEVKTENGKYVAVSGVVAQWS